ncbi:MAG: nucleotide pyrophosphohydrolase [Proteobacteria bacterium]|nr:nucleotide pyrophosphohydrolase [Pseudomonadota bacterium]
MKQRQALDELRQKIREFSRERDWDQFHSPKNLAMAVAAESGELLEVFMWLTEDQSKTLGADRLQAVEDEISDVFICLLNLADRLGVDLLAAAAAKLEKNRAKYPIEKFRGLAKKYDEL